MSNPGVKRNRMMSETRPEIRPVSGILLISQKRLISQGLALFWCNRGEGELINLTSQALGVMLVKYIIFQ
jgi:hypothetical protein